MADLTLTWREHHNNLCGMFEKLLEEGALVDCTLAAEGRYVNVHKAVLAAVSPYFELIFTQESENNPIVILTDIKFQELKAMIDFIYRGKVNVQEEYLDDFVRAAESLQIKGLGGGCIKNQKVSGNENSGTATQPSLEAVDEDMDFEGHSAISSQTDLLNSCRINQCSTSANVDDYSISSRLSHGESELNSICTSNSLCLETCVKREPTTEEEVVEMEFVECGEECVEEDASPCFSSSETTCKSTSSSRLVTAGGLQTDPLGSNAPNQSTSSGREFEKSDQDLLGPVSSLQLISFPQQIDFIPLLKLPSTSGIDKGLDVNSEDVKPRIEFTEGCEEFATEESAFKSEIYTSEAAVAGEREVDGSQLSVQARARTHSGERPHACPTCGKAFALGDSLKQHLRTHSGVRPFVCDTCGKDFKIKHTLVMHLRTHTGERPHACPTCGKAFALGANLKQHVRIHTGERPYACSTCGKAFAQASHLKQHLRTHTGERPFACEECGKGFCRADALAKHQRTHARVSSPPNSPPRRATG